MNFYILKNSVKSFWCLAGDWSRFEESGLDLAGLEREGKLVQRIMSLDRLDELKTEQLSFDVGFYCLGTTRSDAGSVEAFRNVEVGYAQSFGSLCQQLGVRQFHLISSQIANTNSWFIYMKVKGEVRIDFTRYDHTT